MPGHPELGHRQVLGADLLGRKRLVQVPGIYRLRDRRLLKGRPSGEGYVRAGAGGLRLGAKQASGHHRNASASSFQVHLADEVSEAVAAGDPGRGAGVAGEHPQHLRAGLFGRLHFGVLGGELGNEPAAWRYSSVSGSS